jgi:hypothetical protein
MQVTVNVVGCRPDRLTVRPVWSLPLRAHPMPGSSAFSHASSG